MRGTLQAELIMNNMDKLLYLDVETTGLLDEDRLCQVAYQPSAGPKPIEALFKPPLPIKTGAMAVSHITNKMVEDAPVFQGSQYALNVAEFSQEGYVFVAHNAPFDLRMLGKEGITFEKAIDTKKLSHKLDQFDEMESHRMQYLRYHYDLEIPDAVAHTADGDVMVLKALHERLVAELGNPSIEEQIEISNKPVLYYKWHFGKYKGSPIGETALINPSYLEYMLGEKKRSASVQDETDWIYTLEHYLRNV